MIEIITAVFNGISITAVPVIIVLVRYHYSRESEKQKVLTAQNDVLLQLVNNQRDLSDKVDSQTCAMISFSKDHVGAMNMHSTDLGKARAGVAEDVQLSKAQGLQLTEIAKHVELTESKVDDVKSSLGNMHHRLDTLK